MALFLQKQQSSYPQLVPSDSSNCNNFVSTTVNFPAWCTAQPQDSDVSTKKDVVQPRVEHPLAAIISSIDTSF